MNLRPDSTAGSAGTERCTSTKRSVSMVVPPARRSPSRTAGGRDAGRPKPVASTAPVNRAPLLEVRDDKWNPCVIGRRKWQVRPDALVF